MDKTNTLYNESAISNKDDKKNFSKLGIGFFVFALISLASQLILSNIAKKYFSFITESDFYSVGLIIVSFYVIAFPIAYLFLRKIKSEKIEKTGAGFLEVIENLLICFPLMYVANIFSLVLNFIISMIKGAPVLNPLQTAFSESGMVWVLIYSVVIAPVVEELIFRKLLISKTIRYGQFVSVLLSALFFSLFHGNLYQIFYAFVLGGIFAYTYVKTGKIIYTIIMHFTINLTGATANAILLYGFDLDTLMNIYANPNDTEFIMSQMDKLFPMMLLLMAFLFVIFAICVAGLIIFIVRLAKRKFPSFSKGSVIIPKGAFFATVFLNVGVILFVLVCLVKIILNLL